MAEPDWNPDTAGRPLAEILREAGIDTSRAARRRRWDDPDDTGIRQRRPDSDADPRPGYGRRRSDLASEEPAPDGRGERGRRLSDTGRSTRVGETGRSARIADTGRATRTGDTGRSARVEDTGRSARVGDSGRSARVEDTGRSGRGVPDAGRAGRGAAESGRRAGSDTGRVGRAAPDARAGGSDTGRVSDGGRAARSLQEPSTAAIPGLRPSRTPDVPGPPTPVSTPAPRGRTGGEPEAGSARGRRGGAAGADEPAEDTGSAVVVRAGRRPREDEHPSTGPIPVVRDGDAAPDADEDLGPREGAMAWLRFVGELVIALAAGVGVYFLATVLWEQVPYLAVLLAPLAVTGLVAGVSVWRQRMGREAVGARLLAVLVFAGALLTIAPAAGLLAG
jgi:hypothetical protein